MVRTASLSFSLVGVGFVVFLLGLLILQALPAFVADWGELFNAGYWDFREPVFHSLAMFYGTFTVALIAMGVACPLGIAAAVFVSEFLSGPLRGIAKVTIELLAGIPSVVYGLLGVAYLSRWLNAPLIALGGSSGSSLLTAGLILSVMILPTMMTFSDDALRCVPRAARENAWGLGLSRAQTIFHVVLPQARRGMIGAGMLALGRAVGETVAVFLVVGRADRPFSFENFSYLSWFEAGQTVTSKLGGSEIPIAYGDTKHWGALMALGVLLWGLIALLTFASEALQGGGVDK